MARDEKKRQKKLMKKRQRSKARKRSSGGISFSERSILRRARQYPIVDCLINADWEDNKGEGLVRILLARKQPDGLRLITTYLVDMYCLGVKDTMYFADMSISDYREFVAQVYFDIEPVACPPELAHQIVYQAIDYAAQYGFRPQKDFKLTSSALEERGTFPETYTLTFGKNGKPFFVAGPYDNVSAILRKLEKHAGEGNFDYFVPAVPDDLLFDDFEMLLEDDEGEED